jgi:hypothetical protein
MSNPTHGSGYDARLDHPRRCTAHRSGDGKPCGAWAIRGGFVCRVHSGGAPQVKAAARRRLDHAADLMARQLLNMAIDDNVSDAVKLAAIRDALDRSIGRAAATVDVSIEPKPWEQIFDAISSGPRDEFRRGRGYAEDPLSGLDRETLALDAPADDDDAGSADEIVDAELVESNPERTGSDSDSWSCDGPGADAEGDRGLGDTGAVRQKTITAGRDLPQTHPPRGLFTRRSPGKPPSISPHRSIDGWVCGISPKRSPNDGANRQRIP